jgi:hypothetical protein
VVCSVQDTARGYPNDLVRFFNFSQEALETICWASLDALTAAAARAKPQATVEPVEPVGATEAAEGAEGAEGAPVEAEAEAKKERRGGVRTAFEPEVCSMVAAGFSRCASLAVAA